MSLSPYYQYNFVSPEPLISLVKEELKSYIDTGAIDDSIWSIYVDKCLNKLGKGMLKLVPTTLELCNYEARLPDDFNSIREAWLCTNCSSSYQLPGADYQEVTACSTSTLLTRDTYCSDCTPEVIKVAYKTTHQAIAYYSKQYLLKPGNINTLESCSKDCKNIGSSSPDEFDIIGNKFRTNFSSGDVYILYYSKEYDPITGYQLIPDNYRIQEYIEAFIKQKVFEQLSNQVTDETYNQIQQKAQYYKQAADEAFIMADIESKKDTIYKKHTKAVRDKNRFKKYNIS